MLSSQTPTEFSAYIVLSPPTPFFGARSKSFRPITGCSGFDAPELYHLAEYGLASAEDLITLLAVKV
jgi:hypothetical protein